MNEKGARRLASLGAIRQDLIKTVTFACIGWLWFWIVGGLGNLQGFIGDLLDIVAFFGFVIISLPFQRTGLGGMMSFMAKDNYEVITTTTYSDGSVERKSDHGAEAAAFNLIFAIIIVIIGTFVAAIKIPVLIIRYFFTYFGASPKPPISKSIIPVILIGGVVLIAGPIVHMQLFDHLVMGRQRSSINEEERLNQTAERYTINMNPSNRYPMRLTEVLYREDGIAIRLIQTEENAVMPFIFNNWPNPRIKSSGVVEPSFKIVAASGTYYDLGTRSIYDDEKEEYIGIRVLFPGNIPDKVFTVEETSFTGANSRLNLIYQNVRVNR